jgi:transcriptional regulator with XRE-family HTH domain
MSFKTIGERLHYLRKQCRMSRKDIEKNFGISINSLKTWEDNSRRIKQASAKKLVEIYKKHGVYATEEWIFDKNESPFPINIENEICEDSYLLKEVANFENFYEKSRVIRVTDDYMSPLMNKGDYVGGISNKTDFLNKICIVGTKDFGTIVRIIEPGDRKEIFNLKSLSNAANIINVSVDEIYIVTFLRRLSYIFN